MKQAQITDRELIAALKHMAPETGSLLCLGCGHERRCTIHGCAILREAAARLTELTAPPPNDPLTLEELREMDGEPVWISPVKENGKVPARWMLVSGYNQNKDIYLFAPSCNITQGYDGKSYGKTWLAYRRRPEEGTGHGA